MPMVRALFFVILSLLIAGCGGGDDKTSITISATKADFQLMQDSKVHEPVLVNVEFNGDGLLVGYPPGISDPGWLKIEVLSSQSSGALVKLSFIPYWQAGKYSTTVRFVTGRQDGSNLTYVDLPVTAEVEAVFKATPSGTSFEQFIGAEHLTTPTTGHTINIQGAKSVWTVTTNVDWLSLDKTSGSGAGTVNFKVTKHAGNGEGRIVVTDSQSASSKQISVRVIRRQNFASVTPESLEFAVSPKTPLADLTQTLTISDFLNSAVPEQALTWTLKVANKPWITLDKTEGSTAFADKVKVSINSSITSEPAGSFPIMPISENLVLSFTTADKSNRKIIIPVIVYNTMPSIHVVAPYILKPNEPGTLIIRGYGFSHLTNSPKVKIGDNLYPIKSIESNTQLTVEHSGFAAGRYPVSLNIDSVLPLKTGSIVVQAAESMSEQVIAAPGIRTVMTFDDERKRIYAYNKTNAELEVFSYQQGIWTRTHNLSFGDVTDLELTKDGKQLLAIVKNDLWSIDISLEQLSATSLIAKFGEWCPFAYKNIATLNDNQVAFSRDYASCSEIAVVQLLDLVKEAKSVIYVPQILTPMMAASGDGSRLLVSQYAEPGLPQDLKLQLIDTLYY